MTFVPSCFFCFPVQVYFDKAQPFWRREGHRRSCALEGSLGDRTENGTLGVQHSGDR